MRSPSRRLAPGLAVAAAVLLMTAAEPGAGAATGTLAGQVRVATRPTKRLATAGAYPARTIGRPNQEPISELQNVVVYVKTAGAVASAPARVTIRQTNEEFVPHLVAVTAGSTVEFPNDDLIFHNVFSLSRAATFDLGRYPRHASKARVFDKPGIVKVFCHLHSHMSAVVRVFDHPYFAVPDRDGRFTIPDLPEGAHQVAAWHERIGEVVLPAAVTAGETAELSFALPLVDAD